MRRIDGTILQIRALEDSIRATKRYTECLFTDRHNHAKQGNGEPSRAFTRTLEVYLDAEFPQLDWDMDATEFLTQKFNAMWDWLKGKAMFWKVAKIKEQKELPDWFPSHGTIVRFWYDYRRNLATLIVKDQNALKKICEIIPDFADTLDKMGCPSQRNKTMVKADKMEELI